MPLQFSRKDLYRYFIEESNWRSLAGASLCWFLLDFSFYGLGMGNQRTIAKLFATWEGHEPIPTPPSWNTNPTFKLDPTSLKSTATIYDTLRNAPIQGMEIVSIASILGSALFIAVVNYIPRRQWLVWSSISQAVLLIITGGAFYAVFHTANNAVTVVLIAICHFLFNFGANTLTFMIPAEIFPTTYRCSCHGIAAASGKFGSIMVLIILHYVKTDNPNSKNLGWIFITLGCVMAVGAVSAWGWIPEVQKSRSAEGGLKLPSIKLEELGEGLKGVHRDPNEGSGFRQRCHAFRHRRSSDAS